MALRAYEFGPGEPQPTDLICPECMGSVFEVPLRGINIDGVVDFDRSAYYCAECHKAYPCDEYGVPL
jgi:uncharacterized protein with PIN domain